MKEKYKIGDFLLCKRSMNNKSKRLKYFFLKGEKYKIVDVQHQNTPNLVIYLENEKGNRQGFYEHKTEFSKRDNVLTRFFLDSKGMRKMKLKKIKKIFG